MKPRDWQNDAYEICRQTNSPGCVALVIKAMTFGYGLGIHDAANEMKELRKRIIAKRQRSNEPR